MDDLLQEFIAETRETLEALSGEVVAWEANPSDRAHLDAIFRFVHTVKGSCGFLDLPRLLRLSHAAENVLAAAREGARHPDRALVNAVLAIIDRIGNIVEAIDAGASLDDAGEDALIAALEEGADVVETGGEAAPVTRASPLRSVRLSVDLLDRMMSGMSEMVLARNELARRLRDERVPPALEAALERLSSTVADMRDTVTRTRMQRVEALFSALPRIVRDTAAGVGKSVDLVIDGADVELDREMIEMMRDPMVHMIRNAIDHGIEAPAERRAAGKRVAGRLTVSARQSGNRIIIEIADDGRGIDTARLVEKAVRADPRRRDALAQMSESQRLQLIFEPGLSSRDDVTDVSGRGVGMDVVRANINQIGGRIDLRNDPGCGLTVAIHVPLTLAILPAVIARAGDQRFALPRQAIEEIVATGNRAIRLDRLGEGWIATVRDRRMPLVLLRSVLGMSDEGEHPDMLVIVDVPGGSFALGIDAVIDTEELVVKPAAPAVMSAGLYAGQTLPDSGVPMLMIDLAGLAQVAGLTFDRASLAELEEAAEPPARTIPALLFVDLDGQRRALTLAAIDRVEQVPVEAITVSAGRLRMLAEDSVVPLCATGLVPREGSVAIIRLSDGALDAGLVVAEVLEIVTLPDAVVPSGGGGAIWGMVAYEDAAIELVDPLWILSEADVGGSNVAGKPLCLLEGAESGWMDMFLRPTLEGAGYRVVTSLTPGETPAVRLAMEDDPEAAEDEPRVALSRARGRGIFRLDRAALLSAVADLHRRSA